MKLVAHFIGQAFHGAGEACIADRKMNYLIIDEYAFGDTDPPASPCLHPPATQGTSGQVAGR
jgi:hypothetical protein